MMLEGHIRKMRAIPGVEVQYSLRLDDSETPLNEMLGHRIRLSFLGKIHCIHCGKETKKSWQQGYCYPCTLKLAETDICIVKPELCHFAKGTCRDSAWAQGHCMKPHVVYLANSSGVKVGITRESQVPTRWLDQGASEALPLFKVSTRLDSGKAEILLGQHVADKTNWQRMLKGIPEAQDLKAIKEQLLEKVGAQLAPFIVEDIQSEVFKFTYPVRTWPSKVTSLSPEKTPIIESELVGIKGQYLIFASGVLNMRNQAGHLIRWEIL